MIEKAADDPGESHKIEQLHAEELRLSGCLIAINEADPAVPASVLRGIAYDSALNCITPEVARYQIERRHELATIAERSATADAQRGDLQTKDEAARERRLSAMWREIGTTP